jgi:hypothetical protein
VGAVSLLVGFAGVAALVTDNRDGSVTSSANSSAGEQSNQVGPSLGVTSGENPLLGSSRVSLSEAIAAVKFKIPLPSTGVASQETIADIFLRSIGSDGEGTEEQVAVVYESGVIQMIRAAGNDSLPDEGFPGAVSVQLGALEGVGINMGQEGTSSVTFVVNDVAVTFYGSSFDELVEVATSSADVFASG